MLGDTFPGSTFPRPLMRTDRDGLRVAPVRVPVAVLAGDSQAYGACFGGIDMSHGQTQYAKPIVAL